MSDETILDGWLDRWEELQAQGQDVSVEQFVEQHCVGASPDLVSTFRSKAKALDSMGARLRGVRGGRTPGGSTDTDPPDGRPSRLSPGDEPVPGWRLARWIAAGGFGEVWEAVGPGGFHLALKLVPLAGRAGHVEEAALQKVRDLRHAHLLTFFAAWRAGTWLVVACELADRSLADRLQQCLDAGEAGVPASELSRYLRDAAEGLDYLNARSVQHRDVKPSNLLLVGESVKVGDLGLLKELTAAMASHTGLMTPEYAAPEFFDGKVTRHSDQYSLAVAYCELRGGRLPFKGTPLQLLRCHTHTPPDLSMLPHAEWNVVARALNKDPNRRWPSCTAFAEQLAQALQPLRPTGSVSVRLTIVNRTGSVLVLASFGCSSGVYLAEPPASITAGEVGLFCLESWGFLRGADGSSIYRIEGQAGTFEFGYHIPYAFSNWYDHRCPEGYRVQRSGGSGRAAEVVFVVAEVASPSPPPETC
jgi:hypothetical protein